MKARFINMLWHYGMMMIFRHVIFLALHITTDVTYKLFRFTDTLIDSRTNFVAVLCVLCIPWATSATFLQPSSKYSCLTKCFVFFLSPLRKKKKKTKEAANKQTVITEVCNFKLHGRQAS